MRCTFVTGATGFLGSHVAEALIARGEAVRTLARPTADTAFLESLGVTIVRGELTDPAKLAEALGEATVVVHCAAKVGDWGPVSDYREVNVEGLRKLLDLCIGKSLERFVQISSLGVYESRHHYQTDESVLPPESHIDGYTQSKVEAEKLALEYHAKHGIPVTILRPGFIYGERDRTVMPTLSKNLERKVVRYISGGKFALNTTYVGNITQAVLLAIDMPIAVGRIYNITDGEFISKKRFFETVANGLGLPHPKMGGPLWGAKILTKLVEGNARKKGWTTAPRLTMARLKFLGMNLDFSIARARTELGYDPKTSFDDGMARALAWFKNHPQGA